MQTYKLTHWQRPAWSLLAPYTVQRGLSAEAAATLAQWLESARARREVEG